MFNVGDIIRSKHAERPYGVILEVTNNLLNHHVRRSIKVQWFVEDNVITWINEDRVERAEYNV